MSDGALKPGIASGSYPEREVYREDWLERGLHRLRGALQSQRSLARFAERFVSDVHSNAVEDLSEDALSEQIVALRGGLVRDGLDVAHLPRAFALVREVARRTVGMQPYDVQLQAGWAMLGGMLAEMETGEGKTLAVTLPAATAALAGIPVHLISANDYLVERDAESMRPLYERLGLSVAAITDRMRDPQARRMAYACDITYATSSSIAFDYLRDGLQRRRQKGRVALHGDEATAPGTAADSLLLRGLCFAIVDEADSVLVDEARTPLILAGPAGPSDWSETYQNAVHLARGLEKDADFRLHAARGSVELTERGKRRLEASARPVGGIFGGPKRREEWVGNALIALHLFERERHYLVRSGKVEIIDQPTGRAMPDRSWERGLHQMIEVKEGVELTQERETLARISYQQFFRRYLHLAGATGTAQEIAPELWRVYGLRTFVVPTRLPVQRRDHGTRVFATQEEKWRSVIKSIREARKHERPVLVGTCSVAASEHLSSQLEEQGIAHRVLNARQDAHEASIVTQAGEAGQITVATHMAGRGTDIALGEGVAERGGLHVISTERGDARRIDRQLYGRGGRQGDPGSYEVILSLEDRPVQERLPGWLLRLVRPLVRGEASRLGRAIASLAQRIEERRHARMRGRLMAMEEYQDDLLAFSGPGE